MNVLELLNNMPVMLAALTAFLSGLYGYANGLPNATVYRNMCLFLVIFYIIGTFIKRTFVNIYESIKEKAEIEAAEAAEAAKAAEAAESAKNVESAKIAEGEIEGGGAGINTLEGKAGEYGGGGADGDDADSEDSDAYSDADGDGDYENDGDSEAVGANNYYYGGDIGEGGTGGAYGATAVAGGGIDNETDENGFGEGLSYYGADMPTADNM